MAVAPFALAAGIGLVLFVLWDAFETMILPRSVFRLLRLSRVINSVAWPTWSALTSRVRSQARRERYLGFYGPFSVVFMLAIWASALLLGFALVAYGVGSPWATPHGAATFADDLYVSGTTLFTLGLGDIVPTARVTRILIVVETGTGIGFLTVGIAYLPVLYQSFSRREAQITLLDAWAGSPPSAIELLRRLSAAGALGEMQSFLRDWERWCAELLESQISYPQIAYFRSQHGKQSWVAALTAVLDVAAVVLAGVEGIPTWQARMTFAIARHAAVDLSQVLNAPPRESPRLAREHCAQIASGLEAAGLRLTHGAETSRRLLHFRKMYEPYVAGLAAALVMELPPWARNGTGRDNWETTPKVQAEAHL